MSEYSRKKFGEEIKNLFNEVADMLEKIIMIAFIVIMIFTFLIKITYVDGRSMYPTLINSDRIIISNLFYVPKDKDIVVFSTAKSYVLDYEIAKENIIQDINAAIVNKKHEDISKEEIEKEAEAQIDEVTVNGIKLYKSPGLGKRVIKRVIATEGQQINIDFDKAKVYVDGKELFEPYINTLTYRNEYGFSYPFTVPKGFVFAMGDNRGESQDSRHPDIGLVPKDSIMGKVILRIYPFESFGSVN